MSSEAAQRYSGALFELASERGVLDDVAAGLEKVRRTLSENEELERQLLGSKLGSEEKRRLVREQIAFETHPFVVNLLCLLIDRHREAILYPTLLEFFRRLEASRGFLPVEVESARSMDDAQRESFEKRLSEATGWQVTAHVEEKTELIGGLRLIVDSRLLDGSVQRQLEKMKAYLKSSR